MSLSVDDLIAYLKTDLGIEDEIDPDTELFSSGLLDSVSMVGLITYLEERTGAVIQPGDVTLDNFDTAGRIEAYVESLG